MQTQIQIEETELLRYWQRLTSVQQDLVLNLLKTIVREEVEETAPVTVPKEVMDAIWKDREDYLNGIGKNYSWEEVKESIIKKHGQNMIDLRDKAKDDSDAGF